MSASYGIPEDRDRDGRIDAIFGGHDWAREKREPAFANEGPDPSTDTSSDSSTAGPPESVTKEAIRRAFGTSEGDPGYAPRLDVTGDGKINIFDAVGLSDRVQSDASSSAGTSTDAGASSSGGGKSPASRLKDNDPSHGGGGIQTFGGAGPEPTPEPNTTDRSGSGGLHEFVANNAGALALATVLAGAVAAGRR